jgi:hypothetical protein
MHTQPGQVGAQHASLGTDEIRRRINAAAPGILATFRRTSLKFRVGRAIVTLSPAAAAALARDEADAHADQPTAPPTCYARDNARRVLTGTDIPPDDRGAFEATLRPTRDLHDVAHLAREFAEGQSRLVPGPEAARRGVAHARLYHPSQMAGGVGHDSAVDTLATAAAWLSRELGIDMQIGSVSASVSRKLSEAKGLRLVR